MSFTVAGTVSSGFGKGRDFVTLEEYTRQFRDVLGYEPYPGTLNLDLADPVHGQFEQLEPLRIDGWEDSGRSFGIVHCYPAAVDGGESVPLHVIIPKRTDHDTSTLELISPVNLRDRFDLSDGASFEVSIYSDASVENR